MKRVLIDQGSSADMIYFDAFERLGLKVDQLKLFGGTLVGFSNEEVEVLNYIQLEVIFGEGRSTTLSPVKVLIMKCNSSYNVIIGIPSQHAWRSGMIGPPQAYSFLPIINLSIHRDCVVFQVQVQF